MNTTALILKDNHKIGTICNCLNNSISSYSEPSIILNYFTIYVYFKLKYILINIESLAFLGKNLFVWNYGDFSKRPLSEIIILATRFLTNLPTYFWLGLTYQNPFNPTTKIQYSVANSQNVVSKVFNLLGKKAAAIVKENKNAALTLSTKQMRI